MKAPAFWSQRGLTPLAVLLKPFGVLYGAATLRRMARPGVRAGVPVLCVGNFTAGGAGKTPTALALAAALIDHGERPVFLTRGYGGALKGPVAVDPASHDARAVGDEALLLARVAPTVVCADRAAGAAFAAALAPTLLIMDDGLQNPGLAKDFTVAAVDGGAGFGNGQCLPAGPLRAPALAQAAFVDAIVCLGIGAGMTEALALGKAAGKPAYRAELTVDPAMADRLAGVRALAFAGIGRPQKFFETLLGLYVRIEGAHPFADHHAYTDADARRLLEAAQARGLTIITTEKDAVRLKGSPALEELAAAAVALPVRLALPPALIARILDALSAFRARG